MHSDREASNSRGVEPEEVTLEMDFKESWIIRKEGGIHTSAGKQTWKERKQKEHEGSENFVTETGRSSTEQMYFRNIQIHFKRH